MTNNLDYKGTLQLVAMDAAGPAAQVDSTALNPVGCVTRYNGNLYRYVQFSTGAGTVASVAGAPCWIRTLTQASNIFQVTSDYSDSTGVFAGVLLKAAITTLYYVWVLVAGRALIVVNDDTTVKGDRVFATTDATFTRLAQGTAGAYATHGFLLEDRSATTAGKAYALLWPKQVW